MKSREDRRAEDGAPENAMAGDAVQKGARMSDGKAERSWTEDVGAKGGVLMAMSGGVDSSVAAKILQEEGRSVIGATMILADGPCPKCECDTQGRITDEKLEMFPEASDARKCARRLGIDHRVFDMRKEFREGVIGPFCSSYICGKTPNPCIDCNRRIKFGILDAKRAELGCDYLATGHYAIRGYDPNIGRHVLRRGADRSKDQSYVLAFLTQEKLKRVLFPLGDMTKSQTRKAALGAHLENAEKDESQDICFIKDGGYAEFVEKNASYASEPGPILDEGGCCLGAHEGLIRYTIGQRKGLGIASPYPLYVLAKNASDNSLVVGPRESLMVTEVVAGDANLVTFDFGDVKDRPICGWAKTHYRHKGESCKAYFGDDGKLEVVFDEPIVRPAAGQTLVVYDGDIVVGAGIIA